MIGLAEHMVMQNKNPLHFPEVQRKKTSAGFKDVRTESLQQQRILEKKVH